MNDAALIPLLVERVPTGVNPVVPHAVALAARTIGRKRIQKFRRRHPEIAGVDRLGQIAARPVPSRIMTRQSGRGLDVPTYASPGRAWTDAIKRRLGR